MSSPDGNDPFDPEEAVRMPVDGTLDLHAFRPSDLEDLVTSYLAACREQSVLAVRIVHGKGIGVQRARVRAILERLPWVHHVRDGGDGGGGWGATLVDLAPQDDAGPAGGADIARKE